VTSEPLKRIPWQTIRELNKTEVPSNGAFAALDALRHEWERRLKALTEDERTRVRQRTLRKLSVETGILERLYDLDWGLTLTLVAEGFTRDVVERSGGNVDERTLATLRAQMDSLGMVLDFVRQDRPLSASFIKELHQAITRTQETYVITDTLGRVTETVLPRGEWKKQPNHVQRQDNTILEYAPPEHVASEVDRLVSLWAGVDADQSVHPVVKAAWLHHRFVQIHPFADGNGRVARALTLLVLEKHHYAPLVVDRWHRTEYLRALDAANDGNLADLARLFVKLEGAALTNELERPSDEHIPGVANVVAHTLADQLIKVRRHRKSQVEQQLQARAHAVGGHVKHWFARKRDELDQIFRSKGLNDVAILVDTQLPPGAKAHWYRRQITESAHKAGHYADFSFFAGWSDLRIRLEPWQLRYVASLHGAGREPGIMAVTTFAELEPYYPTSKGAAPTSREASVSVFAEDQEPEREYIVTTADAFRYVHSEALADIERRVPELHQILEEGLAVALARLLQRT
jgi:hypothetical protein